GGAPLVRWLALAIAVAGVGMVVLAVVRQQGRQEAGQLRERLAKSEQRVAQLTSENAELTQQLTGLRNERKGLEERLSSVRAQLAAATSTLEQDRVSLEESKERYARLDGERARLEAQVSALTGERDAVGQQVKRLEQEKAEVQRSMARARERMALLDRDYRKLAGKLEAVETAPPPLFAVGNTGNPLPSGSEPPARPPVVAGNGSGLPKTETNPPAEPQARSEAVELPPIVIRNSTPREPTPVRGRIVEVNEPHRFIVIDKGSADGVQAGMVLDILRGAQAVGQASVVRVRPRFAACNVNRPQALGRLQIGDLVVQSGL
ncbi:MAG: hypothetical protein Q8R91_08975, partial [Candidatus Omnitrophota bacterium]|nr:hypothetical protein [Candidatus Omnitrophota bacterium]